MVLNLENGKYTWSFEERSGKQEALRHGEPWRDLCGDNLTLAMGNRLVELQDELTSVANTLDSLVKSGHVSHHPQVELDALTDGMRSVAKGES